MSENHKRAIGKLGAIIGLIGTGWLFSIGFILTPIITFALSLYLLDVFAEAIREEENE